MSTKKSMFTCKWCGIEFEEWTYRHPTFCSAQCRSEYGAHQPKPNLRKPEIHIVKKCAYCGKDYKTTTHQVRLRNGKYCSNVCKHSAQGIRMRGSGNINYKGYPTPARGRNFPSQCRKIHKRDSHTCQVCGIKCGESKTFMDVHHIIKYILFNGDWESANQLSNLILLCRSCHRMVESGTIPCPTIK